MALKDYIVQEVALDCEEGLLSRREALRRLALMGISSAAAATLLAACGDDDDGSSATVGDRRRRPRRRRWAGRHWAGRHVDRLDVEFAGNDERAAPSTRAPAA